MMDHHITGAPGLEVRRLDDNHVVLDWQGGPLVRLGAVQWEQLVSAMRAYGRAPQEAGTGMPGQ
jgi:hypothetical protein